MLTVFDAAAIVVARLLWPEAGAQALGAGALLALIVIVMAVTTVLAAVMFLAVEAPILAWSASKRPPRPARRAGQ
jgi:peptidoglycan/LPS O-acetylase OafA/YrhL